MSVPTREDIKAAHASIAPYIHKTPLLSNASLNEHFGCEVLFKLENQQKVGAFKARGAHNAVFSLSDETAKRGVATHSSGNHAQALALAARNRGIPAFIVMPENAPTVKVNAVREYGGEITFCEANLAARESTLATILHQTGAIEIHPYDNYSVIAGQATCMRELLDQAGSPVDIVVCPVGGGGLLAGTLLSRRYFSPQTTVIAAEPAGADDAFRGMANGERVESHEPNTICDGLLTTVGERNFNIMRTEDVEVVLATDECILAELQRFWQRTKQLIEPSSAVVLAALQQLAKEGRLEDKRVGAIISGGNADILLRATVD